MNKSVSIRTKRKANKMVFMFNKKLGEELYKARNKANLSREELCKKLGGTISTSYLYKIEKCKIQFFMIRPQLLLMLFDACGYDFDISFKVKEKKSTKKILLPTD